MPKRSVQPLAQVDTVRSPSSHCLPELQMSSLPQAKLLLSPSAGMGSHFFVDKLHFSAPVANEPFSHESQRVLSRAWHLRTPHCDSGLGIGVVGSPLAQSLCQNESHQPGHTPVEVCFQYLRSTATTDTIRAAEEETLTVPVAIRARVTNVTFAKAIGSARTCSEQESQFL